MNLTGCKVKHKVYGTGIVVEQDEYLEIVDLISMETETGDTFMI